MAKAPDGTLLGYSYASAYRQRPAYRFTFKNSVLLRLRYHRQGARHATDEQDHHAVAQL
ncbi:MAG: hypothetical protein MO846_08190 [Candidatus Devosia symbiotica]|nr:hypothetical protein [Candidatus Devosia symbiotica]